MLFLVLLSFWNYPAHGVVALGRFTLDINYFVLLFLILYFGLIHKMGVKGLNGIFVYLSLKCLMYAFYYSHFVRFVLFFFDVKSILCIFALSNTMHPLFIRIEIERV